MSPKGLWEVSKGSPKKKNQKVSEGSPGGLQKISKRSPRGSPRGSPREGPKGPEGGAPKGGAPKGGPEGWDAQRAWAPKGGGPKPRKSAPKGGGPKGGSRWLHTTAREPKRVHFRAPALQKHHQNSTKGPPTERRKNENSGGRKKSEILSGRAEGRSGGGGPAEGRSGEGGDPGWGLEGRRGFEGGLRTGASKGGLKGVASKAGASKGEALKGWL